jgi:hypothetical protein
MPDGTGNTPNPSRGTPSLPYEISLKPDPQNAIDRAIKNATAITESKITAVQVHIEGMEKAVAIFQSDLTRVPTQLDRAVTGLRDLIEAKIINLTDDLTAVHKILDRRDSDILTPINHLKDLIYEKFTAVAAQFSERDVRTDQRASDTQKAVDAAFAAAKESTGKIEFGFTKSIDALQELLKATGKSSDDKIDDTKNRLTVIESRTAGISTERNINRTTNQDNQARMFSIIAIVVSVFVGIGQIWNTVQRNEKDQALFDSVQKLQTEQLNTAKTSARQPVERTDLEFLSQRLDALSKRLNEGSAK